MPKPKIKIYTNGNSKPALSKTGVISKELIPTLKEIQKSTREKITYRLIPTLKKIKRLRYEKEIKEIYAELNKMRSEITKHTKEIYRILDSRKALDGLTPKVKKQIFKFIESKLSEIYPNDITRLKKMRIQQEANGLISWIKDHKEKALVKKEIISRIKYYNNLKKKDRDKINEIINYNLALITDKPYLTVKQSTELQKTIFKSLA